MEAYSCYMMKGLVIRKSRINESFAATKSQMKEQTDVATGVMLKCT